MLRVVIDTNILISGIIQKRGSPYKVVRLWEEEAIVLVTSQSMVMEAEKVLNYPKIKKKYRLNEDLIRQTILNLLRYSVLTGDLPLIDVIKEDPDDNKVLSTAVEGRADYIVSGDSHLLGLESYKGIDIVTPKRFFEVTGIMP